MLLRAPSLYLTHLRRDVAGVHQRTEGPLREPPEADDVERHGDGVQPEQDHQLALEPLQNLAHPVLGGKDVLADGAEALPGRVPSGVLPRCFFSGGGVSGGGVHRVPGVCARLRPDPVRGCPVLASPLLLRSEPTDRKRRHSSSGPRSVDYERENTGP
eukprot:4053733-Pyramimonas_sp.AAC.1